MIRLNRYNYFEPKLYDKAENQGEMYIKRLPIKAKDSKNNKISISVISIDTVVF